MSKVFKGIDVSSWQGQIDWDKVKSQIDFAIIRCGYGSDIKNQDDSFFKVNADKCTKLGIPFGAYLYSYAVNTEMALSEAKHMIRMLKGYKLAYPVYIDIEDKCQENLSSKQLGNIIVAFCREMESHGYFVGVYASKYWWETKLTDSRINQYTKWVAQWSDSCTYNGTFALWQYSSNGSISGIFGRVDMNISMVDFPATITKGFNGFSKYDNNKIKVGDNVRVVYGAKSYKGVQLASFVYNNTYQVFSINGDRVVIGIDGQITTDIKLSQLKKA